MLVTALNDWTSINNSIMFKSLNKVNANQKLERNNMSLDNLISHQSNKCHYCNCEMNREKKSLQSATVEHLVDKWSSPKHQKIEVASNLVAACFQCNNSRGSERNRIARNYYKKQVANRGIKLAVASTSSKVLYSLFGLVPQHLFNVKE
jgi:hypothetical protein